MKRKKTVKIKRRAFQRSGIFFVYMLECSDGSLYTGYTNDLPRRVALHNKGGGSKYVKTRLPATLVFSKAYRYYKLAVVEERRMKTLTRKQKEAIVLAHSKKTVRLKIKKIPGRKGIDCGKEASVSHPSKRSRASGDRKQMKRGGD